MKNLSQADCLAVWESGRALHPLDQGLLAVHAAFPESSLASVADWPLGRRNQALAELRCANFGRWLRGWTACRQCSEKLEFQLDGHALLAARAEDCDSSIDYAGCSFRVPTSRDLASVAGAKDAAAAALLLLRQCLLHAPEGEELALGQSWSESDLEAIGERLAHADPLAEILLQFDCPVCGSSFQEGLDLASFLWAELEGRAKRLLRDVHALARAYGWSEAEILSLSPVRRSFYLEMVQA